MVGDGGEGMTVTCGCATELGRRGKRSGRRRRFRLPRPDSFHGEGKKHAADLTAAFDLSGTAPGDDDERRRASARGSSGGEERGESRGSRRGKNGRGAGDDARRGRLGHGGMTSTGGGGGMGAGEVAAWRQWPWSPL